MLVMLLPLSFIVSNSIIEGTEICPRPEFPGDQDAAMSPTQVMKRAARRVGDIPSDSNVAKSTNVIRLKRVLPESLFNDMFPRANEGRGPAPGKGPYTYGNFLKAAAMWPDFCNSAANAANDLDSMCRHELASMFAHFAQEVGEHNDYSSIPTWKQGLYYYTELGCTDNPQGSGCEYRGGTCDATTWMGQIWQCPAGVKYYGRGAKQLSYNYNYGPFSYALFGDVNILLKNPSLVVANDTANGWMALASAFWFYMTPQSPKPSMHDVVTGYWTPSQGDILGKRRPGFGVLIMIINGGIECGGTTERPQAANRIDYYKNFLKAFGLPAEDPSTMTCTGMMQFDDSSSAFIPSYWEQSWSTQSCGVSCQLVSYQTGFSIFDDPTAPDIAYNKCIRWHYDLTTTNSGAHHQIGICLMGLMLAILLTSISI
jgi:chitodextrinase